MTMSMGLLLISTLALSCLSTSILKQQDGALASNTSRQQSIGFESHSLVSNLDLVSIFQLLSHQIRIIYIRMEISCIQDFTLVSKHSTKLLL